MGEPQVYGKYQLLTQVASGGMAEVWLARSSSIGGFEKILAIKRMHPRLSENQDFVSLFIEEAKLTVSLNHPNIVQIFDFGQVDEDYYIAMEFVEGFDLSTLAGRARDLEQPIPVDASVFTLAKVFEGLAYAHSRRRRDGRPSGIIHRDISPHNVLVSLEGQVKISDFGIAKAAEEISATGEIVGKVAYIAPEQVRGEQVGPAADIWSAGVVFYELLTNARCFAKTNEPDTIEAVLEEEVQPPSGFNPDVPEALDALLLEILERDPEKRPADARALAERLDEIRREHWPKTNELRLAQVVKDLWGEDMPELLATDTRRPRPSATLDATVPAQTYSEVAATQVKPRIASSVDRTVADDIDQTRIGEVDVQREVDRLQILFQTDPSLWVLVDIGEVYASANRTARAFSVFKLAAAKFAQSGLLAQAAAIHRRIIEVLGDEVDEDVGLLTELEGLGNQELFERVFDAEQTGPHLEDYRDMLEASSPSAPVITARAPILSGLGKEQFERLFRSMRLHKVSAGETVLSEGEPSETFWWVGRGRVVVSTTNFEGRKVYLSALAEGDCFGEQSFFTEQPQTASVEAAGEALLIEVDRSALDELVREFPQAEETLRQFYKDRIAESLIARSPVFGRLAARDRRAMAERFHFTKFDPGQEIIHEGDESDAFYALRSGHVQVFTGDGDEAVEIAKLGPGEIFGEVAAVKGSARTANVRTVDECELLVLEADDLKVFLEQNPEVSSIIEEQIAEREKDRTEKLSSL